MAADIGISPCDSRGPVAVQPLQVAQGVHHEAERLLQPLTKRPPTQ
jgi:hypothetical protein